MRARLLAVASGLAMGLALAGSPLHGHAQTVYRCGPEGRSYSQQPCIDGRAVDVDDRRSTDQRRDAQATAGRERRSADELARQRRDAAPPVSRATSLTAKPGSKRVVRQADEPANFKAAVPRPPKPPKLPKKQPPAATSG